MVYETELAHYGVLGMKWGVRRFQDKNGRLTDAGKKRYISEHTKGIQRDIDSYKPYMKTGIKTKDGKTVLTRDDVKKQVEALEAAKTKVAEKYSTKWDKKVSAIQQKDSTKKKAGKKLNKNQKKKEKISNDEYGKRTKQNLKIRRAGYAMSIAGHVIKAAGQNQYNMYKDNSSPARTAAIIGLGHTGNALKSIGSMTITGSYIKQYSDFKEWW